MPSNCIIKEETKDVEKQNDALTNLHLPKKIPKDWELRHLGQIVIFLDGKRRPIKDSDRAKMQGDFPYYGASGIIDHINDYIFDEDLILLGEDGENILSRNCRLAFNWTFD